jgi:hypothetical protein
MLFIAKKKVNSFRCKYCLFFNPTFLLILIKCQVRTGTLSEHIRYLWVIISFTYNLSNAFKTLEICMCVNIMKTCNVRWRFIVTFWNIWERNFVYNQLLGVQRVHTHHRIPNETMMTINFDTIANNYEVIYVNKKNRYEFSSAFIDQCLPNLVQGFICWRHIWRDLANEYSWAKVQNTVVYFDWKTVIYIYAWGKCRTQFM